MGHIMRLFYLYTQTFSQRFSYLYKTQYLGVSRSTIFRYENGDIEKIPANLLPDIAHYLQTTEAFLMGWKDDAAPAVSNLFPVACKRVPMSGPDSEGMSATGEEQQTYVMAKGSITADFCLRAKGDGMSNARILDGDIVFVQKQKTVSNGDIAAIVIENESEAVLKRFFYYAEKRMVVLKSENPSFEDLIFTSDELDRFRIIGKAVAFQSEIK